MNPDFFNLLLESVEDYAIFTVMPTGHVASWNAGAEHTFGYTDEEIIRQPFALLFTPEDRERGEHEKEIKEAIANGRAEDERWHIRKDGSRFYASGVLRPLEGMEGFVKVCRDLTPRKQMEDELQHAHDELQRTREQLETRVEERTADLRAEIERRKQWEGERRQLLHRMVTMQEEERRRISRELHDQLGQQLVALSMGLQALPDVGNLSQSPPSYNQQLDTLQRIADDLMEHMHRLAWQLRPAALDNVGLEAAMRLLVEEWSKQSGIAADLVSRGMSKGPRLPEETETALYRVVQEALGNVQRHAQAQRVSVLLERQGHDVVAIVEDDGRGFEMEQSAERQGAEGTPRPTSKRLGVLGMQERMELVGGRLEIESTPGQGTAVYARAPIQNRSTP